MQNKTSAPTMKKWALRYAALGFHILPCHEPLFDHPDGYKCTCEAYRHSAKCQADDAQRRAPLFMAPGQHCPNPGKHPRGAEHGLKDATTDPAKIEAWWTKYPNANIAHVPGRAGFVMLDGDSYKAHYAGGDMLTAAELATPTVTSGNGGTHLYYAKHSGATYTNAPGTLPAGVDVRGDNGYALLPPSLHASGARYSWVQGHEPGKIPAQLLPARIHAILTEAHAAQRKAAGVTVTLGQVADTAPDLAAWALPAGVIERIMHPAAKGARSEADWGVVRALVTAGATGADVHAVFAHYPIGAGGKYAERGVEYLERTLAKALAHLEAHPPNQDQIAAKALAMDQDQIAAHNAAKALAMDQAASVAAWVRTADFGELVAPRLQSERGYLSANTDKRLAMALAVAMAQLGKTADLQIGFHALAERAGMSTGTVRKAVARLEGWYVKVDRPEREAWRYTLAPAVIEAANQCFRIEHLYDLIQDPIDRNGVEDRCSILKQWPLATHAGHDLYARAISAITPEELAERNAARTADDLPPMKATKELRRRLAAAVAALGPGALRVVDALWDAPGQTLDRSALAEGLQMSRPSVWRHVGKLAALGIVQTDDRQVVTLRADWAEMSDALATVCANTGAAARRLVARLQGMIYRINCQLKTADAEQRAQLNRRKAKAQARLKTLALAEDPDLAKQPDRLAALAEPISPRSWWSTQADLARIDRLRTLARVKEHDGEAVDRSGQWKRGELAAAQVGAGEDWAAYHADMSAKYGPGWWATKGPRGVVLGYPDYQTRVAHDRTWAALADGEAGR